MKKREISKEQRRQLERDNAGQPVKLKQLSPSEFPIIERNRFAVWRSRFFLVQLFNECGAIRVSVNRTSVKPCGNWEERITWDELMEIKRQIGMGDKYAIEVLPQDSQVVNVANMRHFFVLENPLQYGWFK